MTMDFGEAIRRLKAGERVARAGWNGKGMFLVLVLPTERISKASRPESARTGMSTYWLKLQVPVPEGVQRGAGDIVYAHDILYADKTPADSARLLPFIGMKTADDGFVPWLASQTDVLAEDWTVVS